MMDIFYGVLSSILLLAFFAVLVSGMFFYPAMPEDYILVSNGYSYRWKYIPTNTVGDVSWKSKKKCIYSAINHSRYSELERLHVWEEVK